MKTKVKKNINSYGVDLKTNSMVNSLLINAHIKKGTVFLIF